LTLWGISDLSPLVSLINLTDLKLTRNNLTVLHPLMGLVNLQKLNLQHNNIVNLHPLTALVNLQELNLQFNRIVDLKPLADNSGLSQGDIVMVERNPLSKMSRDQHIPALEARGVIVRW
ncbi:leucine-rich repeat domain-containing protein, partial [Candidatus Poribacteria bacterium]|nr:leucine-rich repeat domain-containing protein [Candidatus Poribacteria bacterium]